MPFFCQLSALYSTSWSETLRVESLTLPARKSADGENEEKDAVLLGISLNMTVAKDRSKCFVVGAGDEICGTFLRGKTPRI